MAGEFILLKLAVFYHGLPVDKSVLDAGGKLGGILEGGLVDDFAGVKNNDVRVGANLQAAFFLKCRCAFLKTLGRPEGAFF